MMSNNVPFSSNARFFTVSTAGHVDHGKTSLIRALTGIDPDRLKEEKERQMTTDLGFAHLQLKDDFVIGFVDVPGHGKFLKNMLAGVGGIDIALLVVAADEGPMPQTIQHVRILSLLGVEKAVVALSKIDMVDDAEHLELVKEEIEDVLARHGIQLLQIVPVSSTRNIGMAELKSALMVNLEMLPARTTDEKVFLPVDRVFSKSGFGTVITGTLVRGKLNTGDQVVVGPDVSPGRIRRLESFGQTVDFALPGQRVACNLVLRENKPVGRGNVVLGGEVPATRMIVASVIDKPRLIGDKFSEKISSQPVRLYHGTAECHGYVRWAEPLADLTESGEVDPNPGFNRALVLVALEDPAVAQAQDKFVMRMSDETIYGGVVLLRDRPRWLKRAELTAMAFSVLAGNFAEAAKAFIASAPQQIVKISQLSLLLPPDVSSGIISELQSSGATAILGESIMQMETRKLLSQRLTEVVAKLNQPQENKGDEEATVEAVRLHLNPKVDRATYQALIDEETQAGKVLRKGDKMQLPGTALRTLDAATAKLQADVVSLLEQNFCMDLNELAQACKSDAARVKNVVINLSKSSGELTLVAHEFAISASNLSRAHQALADIWNQKRNITPADFKDKLNLTRKYAMPLLQYFDDQKVTRRLNEGRVLLRAPGKSPS